LLFHLSGVLDKETKTMFRRQRTFEDLFNFFRDFDDMFGRTWNRWPELPADLTAARKMLPAGAAFDFTPAVECFTKDKMMHLKVELPGIEPDDVQITVEGNSLFIRGEKKKVSEVEEKDLFFKETTYGRFERNFALPEGVKVGDIKATFRNGILELALPAGTTRNVQKVPIEVTGKRTEKVKAA